MFVEVETDEGITGHGATGYLWPHSTTAFVNREAAPIVEENTPYRLTTSGSCSEDISICAIRQESGVRA